MALTRRVSLFEREIAVRLAPVAIELLHGAARALTEGELTGDAYAGSTMLTVDLARTRDRVSDPIDASTAQRVASLYATDERCRDHARRIATKEARRIAGCELAPPHVDIESRARGHELLLSLNVEAQRERRAQVLPAASATTPTVPTTPTTTPATTIAPTAASSPG
jgi:hypothetical protein